MSGKKKSPKKISVPQEIIDLHSKLQPQIESLDTKTLSEKFLTTLLDDTSKYKKAFTNFSTGHKKNIDIIKPYVLNTEELETKLQEVLNKYRDFQRAYKALKETGFNLKTYPSLAKAYSEYRRLLTLLELTDQTTLSETALEDISTQLNNLQAEQTAVIERIEAIRKRLIVHPITESLDEFLALDEEYARLMDSIDESLKLTQVMEDAQLANIIAFYEENFKRLHTELQQPLTEDNVDQMTQALTNYEKLSDILDENFLSTYSHPTEMRSKLERQIAAIETKRRNMDRVKVLFGTLQTEATEKNVAELDNGLTEYTTLLSELDLSELTGFIFEEVRIKELRQTYKTIMETIEANKREFISHFGTLKNAPNETNYLEISQTLSKYKALLDRVDQDELKDYVLSEAARGDIQSKIEIIQRNIARFKALYLELNDSKPAADNEEQLLQSLNEYEALLTIVDPKLNEAHIIDASKLTKLRETLARIKTNSTNEARFKDLFALLRSAAVNEANVEELLSSLNEYESLLSSIDTAKLKDHLIEEDRYHALRDECVKLQESIAIETRFKKLFAQLGQEVTPQSANLHLALLEEYEALLPKVSADKLKDVILSENARRDLKINIVNAAVTQVKALFDELSKLDTSKLTVEEARHNSKRLTEYEELCAKIDPTRTEDAKLDVAELRTKLDAIQPETSETSKKSTPELSSSWVLNVFCSQEMIAVEAIIFTVGVVALAMAGFFPAALVGVITPETALLTGSITAAVGLVGFASSITCRFFQPKPQRKDKETSLGSTVSP